MAYPYTKVIKNFTDIRPIPAMDGLIIESRDMRGNPETINVLDFSAADLYNLLNEVYNLGKSDKQNEIKRSLGL